MTLQQEEWRSIPGYEDYYEASDLGRIRSVDRQVTQSNGKAVFTGTRRGRVLKPQMGKSREDHTVTLSIDGETRTYQVHTLVLLAFVGPPPASPHHRCKHHNGDCSDNRLENLSWVPYRSENVHATKFPDEMMRQLVDLLKTGVSAE